MAFEKFSKKYLVAIQKKNIRGINSFVISRELEALGCDLVWTSKSKFCTVNTSPKLRFSVSYPSGWASRASKILRDKERFKLLLEKGGVSCPKGAVFDAESYKDALRFFLSKRGEVVVKPVVGNKGRGVTVAVAEEHGFSAAWAEAKKYGGNKIIVEDYFSPDAKEVRVLVVDGRFSAAYYKTPPIVTGDGKSTIRELVDDKNDERLESPAEWNKPIRIDRIRRGFIKKQGYRSVNDVVPVGQDVFIDYKSSISAGGDAVDVTRTIHNDYKCISEKIYELCERPPVFGIDFLILSPEKPAVDHGYVVLEGNSGAGLGSHIFPTVGSGVNVAKMIAESFFKKVDVVSDGYSFDIYEGGGKFVVYGRKVAGASMRDFFSSVDFKVRDFCIEGNKISFRAEDMNDVNPKSVKKLRALCEELGGCLFIEAVDDNATPLSTSVSPSEKPVSA